MGSLSYLDCFVTVISYTGNPNYHFFFNDVYIYERFDFADRLRDLEVRIIDVCNIVKLIWRNHRL